MYPTNAKPNHGLAVKMVMDGFQASKPNLVQGLLYSTYSNITLDDFDSDANYLIIPYILPKWTKVLMLFNQKRIKKIVQEFNPDFIYFHNIFPGILLFHKVLRENKIPYGTSVRGSCYKALKFLTWKKSSVNFFFNNTNWIHFNSNYYMDRVEDLMKQKYLPLDKSKIKLIPNAINDIFYNEPINKIKGEKFKFLIIAGAEPRKNLETLFKAFISFNADNSSELIWIGQKYNQEYFNSLIDYLKPENNIYYKEHLSGKQIPPIIDSANVLVLLSIEETFGNVVAEAVSRQCPVIYSKQSGVASFIKQNQGIEIKDVQNIKEITDALYEIINNFNNYQFLPNDSFKKDEINKTWNNLLNNLS